jgi:hypothetical protein
MKPFIPGFVLTLVALATLGIPACQQGGQGDRCNPDRTQTNAATSPNGGAYDDDECNSGLSCQVPPTCVIAVCCPNSPPYTDPNCACLANPVGGCACTVASATPDAGEDAGEDSGGGTVDSGDSSTADAKPADATAE